MRNASIAALNCEDSNPATLIGIGLQADWCTCIGTFAPAHMAAPLVVIPAKAGIHFLVLLAWTSS
jgi:hypothetical protein